MGMETIRILLADQQELVRTGIRRLLDDRENFQVVAEASSGEQVVQFTSATRPDVVLLDMGIYLGCEGRQSIRQTLEICPEAKILLMTVEPGVSIPAYALEAGASGYLTKDCTINEVVDAIQAVHDGEPYISADIARQIALSMIPGREGTLFDRLSRRERQVMEMVAKGQSTHEISALLRLNSKTVSTYRYRLYEKLGVDNDVELTHLAIRHGVVPTEAGMERQ